jgi:hypothetical protein
VAEVVAFVASVVLDTRLVVAAQLEFESKV